MDHIPQPLDMGIKEHIIFHDGYFLANFRENPSRRFSPLDTRVNKWLGLINRQEFNGKDIFKLFCCNERFFGCIIPHGHVIFLIAASRCIVNACRGRQDAHFVAKTRLGILRTHMTGIKAPILDQEPWMT